MPEPVEPNRINETEVAPGVFLPDAVLRFSFTRSSGPGGQNVNKLSTKARLHLSLNDLAQATSDAVVRRLCATPGVMINQDEDLVITCDTSRSQIANRRECIARLREHLINALTPPKPRKRRRISAAMKRRRLDAKQHRASIKRARGKPSMDD